MMRSAGPLRISELSRRNRLQAQAGSPAACDELGPDPEASSAALASWVFLLVGAYFTLAACLAVLASRGLVADGAFYFITLLEREVPTTFEHGRVAAHALTQWPVVLALWLGVTDFSTLRILHSAGLYYLGPLHLLLCWWFISTDQRESLFWPLLSLFAVSMNAWFVAVTEAHVMTWLFWPLVIFIIHGELRHKLQTAVFSVLVVASAAAYETMALQGLLLTGLALARRGGKTGIERAAWTAVSAWFLLGVGIAIYFALNPRSVANRGLFFGGILRSAGTSLADLNYPFCLSVLALITIVAMVVAGPFPSRVFKTLVGVLATAGILVAMMPILKPESFRPLQQFEARSWVGALPVALALLMLAVRRARTNPAAFRMALGLLVVLALAQTTWQIVATAQWHGYTRAFQEELQSQPGLVAFEATVLARERVGIQAFRNLTWGYTNAYMSIALAPAGQVSTLIGVPRGSWQPFDPRDRQALPKLDRYGVDYSRYLRTLPAR